VVLGGSGTFKRSLCHGRHVLKGNFGIFDLFCSQPGGE
jgi:hypothetical protein